MKDSGVLLSGLVGGSALLQFATVLERQIQSACGGELPAISAPAHLEAEAFFAAPRNATVSFHHCSLSQGELMENMYTLEATSTLEVLADTLKDSSEEESR